MNKESENQKDIERCVDQLIVRKANANGSVLHTPPQIQQSLNHYSPTSIDVSNCCDYDKENFIENQKINIKQKSEEKFVKALKSSSVAIAVTRISDGRFLEVNKSLVKLIGYSTDELLAHTTIELNIWVDIYDRKKLFEELARTGSVSDHEYRFRSKSGDVIFTRYSGEVIDISGEQCVLSVLIDISNYKTTEDLLRKSEGKYRLVVENALELINVTQDGILKYVNQSTLTTTGYSREELVNRPFIEFIYADDRKIVLDHHINRLNGGEIPSIYPFRIVTKQGIIKWFEVQAIVITWDQKPATLNFLREITEQKKIQEALKKSEEKFVKAFKSSPVAICITRLNDGKFIEVNEALVKLSGYSRTELLTGSSIALSLWANTEDRKEVVEQLAKNGSVYDCEYQFRIKSGNVLILRYSAELIDFSGDSCCLSALVDITDLKKMEDSLRENEEKYRSIVENTQDVIMLTNTDGRVEYISPSCFDVLGHQPDDIIGKTLKIIYPEDVEKVNSALSKTKQNVSAINFAYRVVTKNGAIRWVSHSWAPIVTKDKKLKYAVSIIRNITDSKLTEQNLKLKIEELERYKNITVNREIKMMELKKENKTLKEVLRRLQDGDEKEQT